MAACGRVRIRSAGLDGRKSSDPRRCTIDAWARVVLPFDVDQPAVLLRYPTVEEQFKPRWRRSVFHVSKWKANQSCLIWSSS